MPQRRRHVEPEGSHRGNTILPGLTLTEASFRPAGDLPQPSRPASSTSAFASPCRGSRLPGAPPTVQIYRPRASPSSSGLPGSSLSRRPCSPCSATRSMWYSYGTLQRARANWREAARVRQPGRIKGRLSWGVCSGSRTEQWKSGEDLLQVHHLARYELGDGEGDDLGRSVDVGDHAACFCSGPRHVNSLMTDDEMRRIRLFQVSDLVLRQGDGQGADGVFQMGDLGCPDDGRCHRLLL
jgi:hypothetical protein